MNGTQEFAVGFILDILERNLIANSYGASNGLKTLTQSVLVAYISCPEDAKFKIYPNFVNSNVPSPSQTAIVQICNIPAFPESSLFYPLQKSDVNNHHSPERWHRLVKCFH